jgi:hypothetical protein
MLRAFLFPILVSVSCLLLQLVVSRSKGAAAEDHPEFRFSKGLRIFCWVGVFAVTVGPIALTWSDAPIRTVDWIGFGGFAILGFAGCVYADRFVLKFWDDHLSYGAFISSSVDYKDIVSAEMSTSSSGKRFLVIKTSKKRVAISGYLSSVDDAAELLKSKMTKVRGI